jgi:hypothetical protein
MQIIQFLDFMYLSALKHEKHVFRLTLKKLKNIPSHFVGKDDFSNSGHCNEEGKELRYI